MSPAIATSPPVTRPPCSGAPRDPCTLPTAPVSLRSPVFPEPGAPQAPAAVPAQYSAEPPPDCRGVPRGWQQQISRGHSSPSPMGVPGSQGGGTRWAAAPTGHVHTHSHTHTHTHTLQTAPPGSEHSLQHPTHTGHVGGTGTPTHTPSAVIPRMHTHTRSTQAACNTPTRTHTRHSLQICVLSPPCSLQTHGPAHTTPPHSHSHRLQHPPSVQTHAHPQHKHPAGRHSPQPCVHTHPQSPQTPKLAHARAPSWQTGCKPAHHGSTRNLQPHKVTHTHPPCKHSLQAPANTPLEQTQPARRAHARHTQAQHAPAPSCSGSVPARCHPPAPSCTGSAPAPCHPPAQAVPLHGVTHLHRQCPCTVSPTRSILYRQCPCTVSPTRSTSTDRTHRDHTPVTGCCCLQPLQPPSAAARCQQPLPHPSAEHSCCCRHTHTAPRVPHTRSVTLSCTAGAHDARWRGGSPSHQPPSSTPGLLVRH
ncbi:uncharacterized protein LOC141730965 [Zonotrichia albicollis]|uniref:uncharacterized protein LOC141730965 n=1 Tax=Zonotrichia albicollis TaxID=44394 RepID=UPI003D80DD6B